MGDMQIVPAGRNNVEPQYVEMMVPLYSYGCERKVNKALSNIKAYYGGTPTHGKFQHNILEIGVSAYELPAYYVGPGQWSQAGRPNKIGKWAFFKGITMIFEKLNGIYSVKVDFEQQKVTVWGICNKYDVLTTVKSKRKEARFWNAEDNMQESETASDSSSTPPSRHRFRASAAPPLALLRTRSLSWRALKKAFTRTYSF